MLAFAPQGFAVSAAQSAPRTTPAVAAVSKFIAAEPALARQAARLQSAANVSEIDWATLLSQLNLQGMARELAKNSVLLSFTDNRVVLNLAPQHKQLQSNKTAQEKLQAVLCEYFAKPIKLVVQLGAVNDVATPAVVEQQVKQTRQQQAENAIRQDAFVREAEVQLGAQVIDSSIKPV
jgi:DNA polymerase-3 subunit gamma/tau